MGTPAQEYAHWYSTWEKELDDALRHAANDASRRLIHANNVGYKVRSAQLAANKRAVRHAMGNLGVDLLDMLRSGRTDTARLGARVVADAERPLLKQFFSGSDLDAMAAAEEYRAAAGIEAALRRVTETKLPLSSQVYRTNALAKGWVDREITAGLANGLSWQELAKRVRRMIDPNTPGGVSYAAKRLARTELNNAFHASAVARMRSKPWVESVKWNLSGSHSTPDICNEYANSDNEGLGAGIWPDNKVPAKPHPQCLCYVTPVLPSEAKFTDGLLSGQYDSYLDDIMARSGYTADFIKASRFG